MSARRGELLTQNVRFVAMEYHEVGGHRVDELVELVERARFDSHVIPQPLWNTGMLYARNLAM